MYSKKPFSSITASTTTSTSSSASTILLDRKIEETTAGLPPGYTNNLYSLSKKSNDNVSAILNYIFTMKSEVNLSDSYRKDLIKLLSKFSNYCYNKTFKDVTRDDVIAFLDSFRKTETTDPLHKWIGTYNIYRIHLLRFFKWLYSPDLEPGKRQKPTVIDNIPQLKRKETSIYRPSDLWTQKEGQVLSCYIKGSVM